MKVNFNLGSKTELEMVKGIGDVLSSRIIEFRSLSGELNNLDELLKVNGFTENSLENLKAKNSDVNFDFEVKYKLHPVLNHKLSIRNDAAGEGRFGSSREGGKRRHKGVDIECVKGETVYSPITGVLVKIGRAYPKDPKYFALTIVGSEEYSGLTVKLLYVSHIDSHHVNNKIVKGTPIGICQAISEKYGAPMKDHVHVECLVNQEHVDPTLMIF